MGFVSVATAILQGHGSSSWRKARVSIEAGSTLGWERYVGLDGAMIGLDRFGASAPGEIVMRELGFSLERIVKAAKSLIRDDKAG